MNKATLILIAIVFIGSIALINLFGMEMSVYNEDIPVTSILCINESDERVSVISKPNQTLQLKTTFTDAYDKETNEGTFIQIQYRVLPDNASNKKVKFIFDEKDTRFEFYQNEDSGEYTGLVLFYKPASVPVTIMSADGRKVIKKIILRAVKQTN